MALMHWDTLLKLDEVRDGLHRVFSNVPLARSGGSEKQGAKPVFDSLPPRGNVSQPLFKLEDGAIACGSCLHGSNGSR